MVEDPVRQRQSLPKPVGAGMEGGGFQMRFSQSLYYPKLGKGVRNRQVLSQYQKVNEK